NRCGFAHECMRLVGKPTTTIEISVFLQAGRAQLSSRRPRPIQPLTSSGSLPVVRRSDISVLPHSIPFMMRSTPRFLSLVILLAPLLRAVELAPYLDPAQPVEQRVADLIARLTLEQKAALRNHRGPTVTVDDRPIRADQWNQCLNGVQWDRPATLFPTCI